MSLADELSEVYPTECVACDNDGEPCNLCKPGSIPVGFADEDRIRAIVREELAAWLGVASISASEVASFGRGGMTKVNVGTVCGSYREYLATRDEPPAVPPMRVVNTTERL